MKKNVLLKVKASGILLMLALAFFVTNIQPAKAIPVEEVASVPQILSDVKLTFKEKIAKILKTVGAKLVGTTVRNTLNRLAMDAAKAVATSGEGQKPNYIVSELGGYWKNVGDAAAGDFIDSLGDDWGIDLCTPPSTDIQAKISLGLVQTVAPEAPDCTVTKLVSNYSTAYEKLAAMKSGDYLKAIQVNFDPTGSELGGAFTLFGRTFATSTKAAETEKDKTLVNKGWIDVRNIAGKLEGVPDASKDALTTAKNIQAQSLLVSTGDVLVDAANTFLNQLAYEGFQRVLRELSKGKTDNNPGFTSSGYESLIQYGEAIVNEKLASVIKPRFDVRSDYSIVTDLASCVDRDNPGPTSCVIDDKFSQAISEKLTVGEALAKGYLHGDWLVSNDNKSESTYTLRSARILRKYRIVPVGWEHAISVATEEGYRVTFQDLVSCFDGKGQFSSDFDINNQSWCRGLVDPNWVLKATLNFCSKQGYGNQILSSIISRDANNLATLAISRSEDYCADDQTCIKEKIDGSCEVYGYCNEEKRTWRFGTDSCEPVYNTCQTFTSASDKQVVSFLENTLDYSTCDQNNSGCKTYSYNGAYLAADNSVQWNKAYSIFFNNKIKACDALNEGCTEMLRGKPGWSSVNYVMDADFKLNKINDVSTSTTIGWFWPIENGVGTIISLNGEKALSISGSGSSALYSNNTKSLLPKNLTPIAGWSYTLSADVKLISGDKVIMTLGDKNNQSEITGYELKTISVTVSDVNTLDFKIKAVASGGNASFVIKNLILTPNSYNPGFSSYASFPVYEKLLPNYLESTCYKSASGVTDYALKDGAPVVCSDFVRKCNLNEVGCELFTSVKDLFSVPAKANVNDYCDASCVGYDAYLAKESYFYETSVDNLIPNKTEACKAEGVGCSSFTNLDAVNSGGEKVEYYTKIKQCIKPDTTSCGDFYTWDSAQLKVMSLKKDSSGNPDTANKALSASCSKEIYSLPVGDPRYNSDCREFYSKSGAITYNLISNTISCSDDCYSYRLNEKNIDSKLSAASCVDSVGNDRTWDATNEVCYVCKNGGVWNDTQKACVYKAIPGEGTTCVAEEVGCREYNGNNGNSLKLKAAYDFEVGTSGFAAISSSIKNDLSPAAGSISQSLESTVKNGHSLSISGGAKIDASSFALRDSAYIVKFIAKAPTDSVARIYFTNSNGDKSHFNKNEKNLSGDINIKGGNTWRIYEVNLGKLDHQLAAESLVIENTKAIFIDNFIINEITDKYYLIKGTSQVPDVCFYDLSDVFKGPNYNLGCAAYTDRSGATHNLYQFSELCQDSAVGCEQMILTNNSSKFYDYTVNLSSSDKTVSCTAGTPDCLGVKGAQAIYAVFDAKKQCNNADAGCSRFGYFKTVGNTSSWVDNYKINSPDLYLDNSVSPLCRANEVGCDTWLTNNNLASYFKNPGINACILKDNKWYKMPVKRCDANNNEKIDASESTGPICSKDTDCANKKCITDSNDYPCSVVTSKTFGIGGAGNEVPTPSGSAGLCTSESSGCSEYIDPASKYVDNLISNPAAEEIDGMIADKWTPLANGTYSQVVGIKANKLYVLQLDGNNNGQPVVLDNFLINKSGPKSSVRVLQSDNYLSATTTKISTFSSIIFNSGSNTSVTVYRNGVASGKNVKAALVSLKEVIINYQLKNNIDTTSCNGIVNTEAGCVLFNARTQSGASGLKGNIFNAALTPEQGAPAACGSDQTCINNANSVIKVSPDRVCSRWLSCQTYTEDPVTKEKSCYKIGECDQLNEKNECGNFLAVDGLVRDTPNKNATGYSLLNNWYVGGMKEVGLNTDAHFDFENTSVNLTCRRDIDVASNAILGADKVKNSSCVFDKNINDSLVLTPEGATTDYPAQGRGFLKVLNYYQISPQSNNSYISAYTNQDYYVNYLVNTKGSSARAKLMIVVSSSPVRVISFVTPASNGWERKVYKFNFSDNTGKKAPINIKIYLSSDATDLNTGYVYFDDINIEPVLQTGVGTYVSKDCRLYPSYDSNSCLSANNNVIKDGLYGYCLEYDPLNPGVCLLWYPIDKISPITRNNQSSLGYSGKFPLYYCTEANGGFNLVEKRNGVFHMWADSEINGSWGGQENDWEWIKNALGINLDSTTSCSGEGITTSGDCKCLSRYQSDQACGTEYNAVYSRTTIEQNEPDVVMALYCVPKQSLLSVKSQEKTVSLAKYISSEYGDKNKMSCKITFNEGWGIYNGFFSHDLKNVLNLSPDINFDTEALSNIREAGNNFGTEFDSVMVLESGKSLESDLKYISGSDTDKVFRVSCNKFSKFVENDGTNMAWSGRISRNSIYSTTTPDFFDKSFFELKLFGRNREDVPFGSASLTSDYDIANTEPLVLRNQYSKQLSETLFAGRPYGCFGTGCVNLGQCSTNPNVFCLYSSYTDDINKKGCSAGGNGTCIPLWSGTRGTPTEANALSVLNQIFVNKYGDFKYDINSRGYIGFSTLGYFRSAISMTNPVDSHTITVPSGIERVMPKIENVSFSDSTGAIKYPVNGKVDTLVPGLYKLSFNVIIDKEQQPMKQIVIDWGDSTQVITGLDNKPENSTPHVFYHFYLRGVGRHLEIKAIDNWGAYKCLPMSGNSWGGTCGSLD